MNFDQYHEMIDELIYLNLAHRAEFAEYKPMVPPAVWAREFCTVRCNIGRRTGKSEYIKARAREGDLIIAPNLQMRRHLFPNMVCDVETPSTLNGKKFKRFDTVFVDEPSLVFLVMSPSDLFALLAHDGEQTFVMLGI